MAPYFSPSSPVIVSRWLADLDPGGADRLVEPLQLVVHRVAGDEAPGNAKALGVHHQRFADGDAGGNGNSL